MLNRINARFAGVKIILYPALMQGSLSSASVIEGLEYFETLCKTNSPNKPSLVIVARGGGSFEDLFTFNDEALVVKAANFAAKSCALISAIGHGTDFTLLDLAASVHAVTPTAAAELASPDGKAIRQNLKNQQEFISTTITKKLNQALQQLDYTFKMLYKTQQARLGELEFKVKSLQQSIVSITDARLKNADFAIKNIKVSTGQINRLNIKLLNIANILCYKTDSLLQGASTRLRVAMEQNLGHLIQKIIEGKMLKLNYTSGRAEGLYAGITKSIITDEISGSLISSVKQLTKSQQINITMADGKAKAMIL
jgi:exodeoxyribonuclease VII large subunit